MVRGKNAGRERKRGKRGGNYGDESPGIIQYRIKNHLIFVPVYIGIYKVYSYNQPNK